MKKSLSQQHLLMIKERTFDVSQSNIRIRLNSEYFTKPVPVYDITLLDNKLKTSTGISEPDIIMSLTNFFSTKKDKTFEIERPEFKFECDIDGVERLVSAIFKFKDNVLFITKIVIDGESDG